VYINNAHWQIKGVFDNLVKFVYELGKNWQTRAWDPVFKTAGSVPDAAFLIIAKDCDTCIQVFGQESRRPDVK
jgi:hypothetical protein